MHTITRPFIQNDIPKLTVCACTGAAVTFGIFVGMAKLIANDIESIAVSPPVVLSDIIYEEEPAKTIVRTPLKVQPKTPRPPAREVQHEIAEPNFESGITNWSPVNHIETVSISQHFEGMGDSFATPMVRINPNYPPEAARDGIEGWVRLGFTIAKDGTVSDIVVLDAQPKRIFDREARKALSKWKYKPSFKQGVAHAQPGMTVVLEFNLEQ